MTEIQPPPSSPDVIAPELLRRLETTVGFSSRFLLGGIVVNPETPLTAPISETQLAITADRFVLADRAVKQECAEYWQRQAAAGGPADYDGQKRRWIADSAAALISTDHAAQATTLKALLQKTGDRAYEALDAETASNILEKIQEKYFESNEEHPVNTHQFVQDTLQAYMQDGGILDVQRLLQDRETIRWFCRIFGDRQMDIIMTDIITACAQYRTQPQTLVEQANAPQNGTIRADTTNLRTEERNELSYLWSYHLPEDDVVAPAEPVAPAPAVPPAVPAAPDTTVPTAPVVTAPESPPAIRGVIPVPLAPEPLIPEDDEEERSPLKRAMQEIFDRAGKRSREEMQRLIADVSATHIRLLQEGYKKLPATIQEAERLGFVDIVCDRGVTYVPKGPGEIVIIGDLHGDFAALKHIIESRKFLENMERGDRSMRLVILGDMIDRGTKDVETMEAVLELKRRYSNNVVIMKADHETDTGVSHHDYPLRVLEHYYDGTVPVDVFTGMLPDISAMIEDNPPVKHLTMGGLIGKDELIDFIRRVYTNPADKAAYDQQFAAVSQALTRQIDRDNVRDFLAAVQEHIAEHMPLFQQELYNNVFTILPRAVICGNGAVLVHGGPTYEPVDMKGLARLPDKRVKKILDQDMTWADPDPQAASYAGRHPDIAPTLDRLIAQAASTKRPVEYEGNSWRAETLQEIKGRLEQVKRKGFWFNTTRTEDQKLLPAVWNNLLLYGEEGLKQFLQPMGAAAMVRGHQPSTEVRGGKPDPFDSGILYTIHSTGAGSPDSATQFQTREPHPTYAVLDRNEDITRIDPDKHIKSVW